MFKTPYRRVAVIGTAGRDKSKPMTKATWEAMVDDLRPRLQLDDVLISGGAAWADHLAVHAYLQGWCQGLKLYLPAPFQVNKFLGPSSSAASAANYYHQQFQIATGVRGLSEIHDAIVKGAIAACEPAAAGYAAMFARNAKVAGDATLMLAYTFGDGAQPADGGTLNTWNTFGASDRIHIPLMELITRPAAGPQVQLGLLPRNDPSLTIVPDWQAFYEWAKDGGYGEDHMDVNDSRCMELQRQFLNEQKSQLATPAPSA